MGEKRRWVIKGFLEGGLFIPRSDSNLPMQRGKITLTGYAILEQNLLTGYGRLPSRVIYLGLEIPAEVDHVCVAYQEMEAFIRALAIEKNVLVTVYGLTMTEKAKDWPEGIDFLEARDFSICHGGWQPVDHHKDPKNRIRLNGISGAATTANLGLLLENRHWAFSTHDEYRSELVKDYTAGLDVEPRHPSLAMLYYFKVLERVGKLEYNDREKTMSTKTLKVIVRDIEDGLTADEKRNALSVVRWRHNRSEAHLITEGMPTTDQLGLCKKMARLVLLRTLSISTQ